SEWSAFCVYNATELSRGVPNASERASRTRIWDPSADAGQRMLGSGGCAASGGQRMLGSGGAERLQQRDGFDDVGVDEQSAHATEDHDDDQRERDQSCGVDGAGIWALEELGEPASNALP